MTYAGVLGETDLGGISGRSGLWLLGGEKKSFLLPNILSTGMIFKLQRSQAQGYSFIRRFIH